MKFKRHSFAVGSRPHSNSKFTIIEDLGTDGSGQSLWLCMCDCGNVKEYIGTYIANKRILGCGCSRGKHKVIDLTGQLFGRLTVVSRDYVTKRWGNVKWLCRCLCGKEVVVASNDLRGGHTISCGCWRNERRVRHGHIYGGKKSPEYLAWASMKRRCLNPRIRNYYNYGGRGITVCTRWLNGENGIHPFLCFLHDMGHKPASKHSLDRIDVNGNYEPSNCRWATTVEQSKNKRKRGSLDQFSDCELSEELARRGKLATTLENSVI